MMEKRISKLLSLCLLLFVAMTGCKDDDDLNPEAETPSIELTLPGLTVADNVVRVPVSADSSVVIDYSVKVEGTIRELTIKLDETEELVEAANDQEEFLGSFTVAVPYETRTIMFNISVEDTNGQTASQSLSIDVVLIERVFSGESGGIRWEADKLADGTVLKLFDAESRFGTKVNPLPMYFFDFSAGSATPHPVYSRKDGRTIVQTTGGPSTEQIPPQKEQSWKAPLKDVTYASSVVKIKDSEFANGISIVVRRFWTHDGNTDGHDKYGRFNHKLCRLWSGGGINPYYQYDRLLMEQSPVKPAKYWSGATYHTPYVRTWVLDEVRYVPSSELDVADASVQLRRNGTLVDRLLNTVSRSTEKPQEWEELAIDQVVNLSEVPEGFAVYYDVLAVDDSEQRVMLTNNKDLRLATEKEYLPARAWTDGKIEVYLRQGTFSSIRGGYVCIQDENGDQIGEGIQLQ